MNSKKGFTLVELLGVLVVLGLISVIIVPKVIDSITTSKEAAYQTQVETIENAAKKYGISNDLLYPKEGEKKYIAVKDLIAVGELSDKEIINPIRFTFIFLTINIYCTSQNFVFIFIFIISFWINDSHVLTCCPFCRIFYFICWSHSSC